MSKAFEGMAKAIIDKIGTEGAEKLMNALDFELDKIKHPEDYAEEQSEKK